MMKNKNYFYAANNYTNKLKKIMDLYFGEK
jgi:hypothetical protein